MGLIHGDFETALKLLWAGFLSALITGIVYILFQDQIQNNSIYIVGVLLLVVPGSIAHLVLLQKLLSAYKWKLLPTLLFAVWPPVFLLFVTIAPFVYLFYLTYVLLQEEGDDASVK